MRIDWMLESIDGVDGLLFLQEILRCEDLSFYNQKSLRMIIEFLYKRIKFIIIILMLPFFALNFLFFITVALINEELRKSYQKPEKPKITDLVKGNESSKSWTTWMIAAIICNSFFVAVQSIINFKIFLMMGLKYWQRFWSFVDLFIFTISIVIIAQYVDMLSTTGEDGFFEQ